MEKYTPEVFQLGDLYINQASHSPNPAKNYPKEIAMLKERLKTLHGEEYDKCYSRIMGLIGIRY